MLEGFGLFGFGEPGSKSEADIIALGSKVCTRRRRPKAC